MGECGRELALASRCKGLGASVPRWAQREYPVELKVADGKYGLSARAESWLRTSKLDAVRKGDVGGTHFVARGVTGPFRLGEGGTLPNLASVKAGELLEKLAVTVSVTVTYRGVTQAATVGGTGLLFLQAALAESQKVI